MKKIICIMLFCVMVSSGKASFTQAGWIQKIEQYMNAARTWEAEFEQINPNGSLYEGKFFLFRPGKMRLIYHYPKNQTLIADGKWFIVQDTENDELTTLALKETPADFFLQETICFSQDVQVVHFRAEEGIVEVTLSRVAEPQSGALTLVFSQKPLALLQWTITDVNQLQTTIKLRNIIRGHKLNPQLFVFSRPDLLP